jgi:hypothetical protein
MTFVKSVIFKIEEKPRKKKNLKIKKISLRKRDFFQMNTIIETFFKQNENTIKNIHLRNISVFDFKILIYI